jgi:hypothetical protein
MDLHPRLLALICERAMDVTAFQLSLFLSAAFVAAFVAGVSGFAFALIAAAVWLHILSPLETATLIIGYGLIVQGYGFWKLRHAFSWNRLWPFIIAGAPGVTIGVHLLRWANPSHIRIGIAAFLVAFSIYSLARPRLKPVPESIAADMIVGLLSGMLGAVAGFPGILIVIWCGLRRWSKDEQRGVFRFPAGQRGDAADVRCCARCHRIGCNRHHLPVPDRPAGAAARHLGWFCALRPHQRGSLSQDRALAAAGCRTVLAGKPSLIQYPGRNGMKPWRRPRFSRA